MTTVENMNSLPKSCLATMTCGRPHRIVCVNCVARARSGVLNYLSICHFHFTFKGPFRARTVILPSPLRKKVTMASDSSSLAHHHPSLNLMKMCTVQPLYRVLEPIPLTQFWIGATCGKNKYFYLVSLLGIDFFSPKSHLLADEKSYLINPISRRDTR